MNKENASYIRDMMLKESRPRERVELPELGISVWVQGLTAHERDAYEGEVVKRDRKTGQMVPQLGNARAKLVAMSLVDDEGKYVFDINKPEEVTLLGGIPARTMQHIFDKASELSGLSEADMEELEQGFGNAPQGESSTDSRGTSDGQPKSSASLSQVVS